MSLPYSFQESTQKKNQVFGTPTIITYSDLNNGFTKNGEKLIIEDVQAINGQITELGSMHFEPTFGSKLPYLLFEPVDDITAWELETEIFMALANWMPRIRVLYPLCSVNPLKTEDGYEVDLYYQIKIQNITGQYKAKVYQ
jgi:phage baseplate assembly protein W